MIYERMKTLGKLDVLKKAIGAKDWSKQQKPGRYTIKEHESAKIS
jgi:hypothetical protein